MRLGMAGLTGCGLNTLLKRPSSNWSQLSEGRDSALPKRRQASLHIQRYSWLFVLPKPNYCALPGALAYQSSVPKPQHKKRSPHHGIFPDALANDDC
jgi:hypothetical protein